MTSNNPDSPTKKRQGWRAASNSPSPKNSPKGGSPKKESAVNRNTSSGVGKSTRNGPKRTESAPKPKKVPDLMSDASTKSNTSSTSSSLKKATEPKRSSLGYAPGVSFGGFGSGGFMTAGGANRRATTQPKRGSLGYGNNAFTKGVTKMFQAPVKAGMYAGQKFVEAGTKTSNAVVQAGTAVTTTVGHTVVSGGKAVVGAGTAVGTTVGNTVVYGGKAVVGGGKAIVEGTGALVEFGGNTVVKGVKVMTSPFSMKRDKGKKSKWDEGVEVIDSLLEPHTETYQAMTSEQRLALANVRKLLLRGPNEQDKIAHIPRDLLREGHKEQKQMRRATATTAGSRVNRRQSTNFILQEYAGVRNSSAIDDLTESEEDEDTSDEPLGPTPEEMEIAEANADATPTIERSLSVEDMDIYYVPPEFKNLSQQDQEKLCNLLSWENLAGWDFNVFELDLLTQNNPLFFVGWAIIGSPHAQSAMAGECGLPAPSSEGGYKFLADFTIPPRKLCNYLRIIQQDYHSENPYHNAIHAADVVQSLNVLLQMGLGTGALANCPNGMVLAILLSAIVHDVGHPGKTNAFHTKLRTELAVMYNDTSVLENWHIAHAFARMLDMDLLDSKKDITTAEDIISAKANQQSKHSDYNILCNVAPEDFNTIRNYMIEAVLHTDMTKHFTMVNAARGMLLDDEITVEDRAWKLLMFMLHMADISGQAKDAPMFMLWTQRCMAEFFAQGDQEAALGLPISPNCDRQTVSTPESQMGFIKFVVGPAYAVLGEYIPAVQQLVLPIIQRNLEHWTKESELISGPSGTSADC